MAAPFGPRTSYDEALELCRRVEEWGFDAVTPVTVSVLPDTTLARGDAPTNLRDNKAMAERLRLAAPRRRTRTGASAR